LMVLANGKKSNAFKGEKWEQEARVIYQYLKCIKWGSLMN